MGGMNALYHRPGESIYAKRLRDKMQEKGLNPVTLGREAGISNYCIYSQLREERTPDAVTLAGLADALGVSMDWLWGRI